MAVTKAEKMLDEFMDVLIEDGKDVKDLNTICSGTGNLTIVEMKGSEDRVEMMVGRILDRLCGYHTGALEPGRRGRGED